MDSTTVTTAAAVITGLKNLTDLCKAIIPLARKTYPELSEKAQQFLDQLMELKLKQGDLVDENSGFRRTINDLEMEIQSLKAKLVFRGQIVPDGNRYFRVLPDGNKDGPFCTRCHDAKDLLIRLHAQPGRGAVVFCPECKTPGYN